MFSISMRFRYWPLPLLRPAWTLAGRMQRPKPIVFLSVNSPWGTVPQQCLLDTGADDTVFHERVARRIGLDLTIAPLGDAKATGGTVIPVRFAVVTLRLSDGREHRQWPARVAFTPVPLSFPLLGFASCLQFFGAYFDGEREEVELTVNSLYPGT